MKRFGYMALLVMLSACAGRDVAIQEAGDGVYYASSPPEYTYVYGASYMPSWLYYSPYYYPHYFYVWSSPLIRQHYLGFRPPYYPAPAYGTAWAPRPLPTAATAPPDLAAIYRGSERGRKTAAPTDVRQKYRQAQSPHAAKTGTDRLRVSRYRADPALSASRLSQPMYRRPSTGFSASAFDAVLPSRSAADPDASAARRHRD